MESMMTTAGEDMSDLWEDIRGQLVAEAAEDESIEFLVFDSIIGNGSSSVNIPLKCLSIKSPVKVYRKNIPAALRWEIWERDDFTCVDCGDRQFLVIDHIYPVARGGLTTLENLQTLCRSCNSYKHTKVFL